MSLAYMTPQDDGGPAYPVFSYVNIDGETHDSAYKGMSLRDAFAMAALQGLMSNCGSKIHSKDACVVAYEYADAMLEERKK